MPKTQQAKKVINFQTNTSKITERKPSKKLGPSSNNKRWRDLKEISRSSKTWRKRESVRLEATLPATGRTLTLALYGASRGFAGASRSTAIVAWLLQRVLVGCLCHPCKGWFNIENYIRWFWWHFDAILPVCLWYCLYFWDCGGWRISCEKAFCSIFRSTLLMSRSLGL